ncbi:zinc dependent phospholipase C family protein [Telmatobacter sp. DSM 110680]|uniref:Zinc dependent phospholipase C family protein n=1 Tax=Telmatobacter sp. DSM 110680 TaxID=3036704 RepID=A0AAU7DQR2_9BACT
MKRRLSGIWALLAILFIALSPRADFAYSLLTHEQLIDLTWKDSIVPLLLSRYPNLTPAQLDQARAYAYGGCVIQDIGYYPFGDANFSNLTHYVRSGDFVVSLFRNAHDPNELAFAIGALSHYIGDSIGHAEATNVAVPIEFPKLRAKYGSSVSYAEGEHQHVQTEFAFDINEIAHHRIAPLRFMRHIGLAVSMRQLALAYYQTYGLSETFSGRRGVNVRGYRFAVHTFIPRIAYAVTLLHRRHEPPDPTSPDVIELEKEAAEVAQDNHWQQYRHKAGIGTYLLAGFLFILPKIGPLTLVAVKGPTEQTEADYAHSVAVSTTALRRILLRFTPEAARYRGPIPPLGSLTHPNDTSPQARDPRHPLPNRDLDTGRVVQPGGYSLTDSTYASLLHQLVRDPKQPIPPGIKEDIQKYYSDLDLPITTKKNPDQWKQVLADLTILATMPTSTSPEPFPTYGDNQGADQ